ncbi:hypothetical protein D9757_000154 [Collybiopsis confluens]|uniref:Transmembrane protein n=1 Tax=Collybiopsis confluens TaxID=2823264 RepID=A0A8H5I221_9AGAR|nr:hypothetical protein D9757_000154 [Collybiopsis confluens]
MGIKDLNVSRRQDLGGVLGGVNSIVSDAGSGLDSVASQAGSGLTSGLGAITSAALQTATTTTPTSTSSSTTQTPISSTSRTSSSTSSTSSSSSSSSTSTTSSSTTSSSTSSSAISQSSASVFVSTSDGVQHTITALITPSASPSPSDSSNSSNAFLSNKPLEGFVFALCGVVVLVIIFLVATFAVRRSRRKKMMNEALSYEPTTTHGYIDDMERGLAEKTRHSLSSTRSGATAHGPFNGYSGGSGMPPVQARYGYEHEYPAYVPQSPNLVYDVTRAYGPPHVGGSAFDQTVPMNPSVPSFIPPSQAHLHTIPRVLVRTLTPEIAAARYEP